MPAMVFRTGDYIRCHGLMKNWPDPKSMERVGLRLLELVKTQPHDDPTETGFRLFRLQETSGGSLPPVENWSLEVKTGSVVNVRLEPGKPHNREVTDFDSGWKNAVLINRHTWLNWIEHSDTIVLTWDET